MKILDKKSNRVSRVIVGVSEANLLASFPKLQRILDFLSLRNLLSNELFFTFCEFVTTVFFIYNIFYFNFLYSVIMFSTAFLTISGSVARFIRINPLKLAPNHSPKSIAKLHLS